MPLKFSKEVSTHLFKYINKIEIKFNPFDERTRSARELLRQVSVARFIAANPRLDIDVDNHDRADAPMTNFYFIDGSETKFESKNYHAKDILFEVHLKASQIDAEYEMGGKSIDDA